MPNLDKTLTKGITILETLAEVGRGLGVTEISDMLNLTKSNTYRLLKTLSVLGYVAQNPDRTYRVTLKLWSVGHSAMQRLEIHQITQPILQKLADTTQERVNLAALAGHELLYVAKLAPSHPFDNYTYVGGHSPLHCTAAGKALLAFQDEAFIDLICANLTTFTKNTITDEATLRRELKEIRTKRISISQSEHREGVSAIAAPIHEPSGRTIAAIGLAGPATRLTSAKLRSLSRPVLNAAQSVESALRADANRPSLSETRA